MSEQIRTYTPSAREQQRLVDEGISLSELLQYDQPPLEEVENMSQFGIGLVDAILMTDLRKSSIDTVGQIAPLIHPIYPRGPDFAERVTESQNLFISLTEQRLSGNPYPGKGFSKDQMQKILEKVKSQLWTPDTINTYILELDASLMDPSKDNSK